MSFRECVAGSGNNWRSRASGRPQHGPRTIVGPEYHGDLRERRRRKKKTQEKWREERRRRRHRQGRKGKTTIRERGARARPATRCGGGEWAPSFSNPHLLPPPPPRPPRPASASDTTFSPARYARLPPSPRAFRPAPREPPFSHEPPLWSSDLCCAVLCCQEPLALNRRLARLFTSQDVSLFAPQSQTRENLHCHLQQQQYLVLAWVADSLLQSLLSPGKWWWRYPEALYCFCLRYKLFLFVFSIRWSNILPPLLCLHFCPSHTERKTHPQNTFTGQNSYTMSSIHAISSLIAGDSVLFSHMVYQSIRACRGSWEWERNSVHQDCFGFWIRPFERWRSSPARNSIWQRERVLPSCYMISC